jgi:hypothetical protein
MSDRDHFRTLGRRGGLALAASTDMRAVAAHARKRAPSSLDYWRTRVDPTGVLDASDRESRARAAQRLHFSELAQKSARARRKSA